MCNRNTNNILPNTLLPSFLGANEGGDEGE